MPAPPRAALLLPLTLLALACGPSEEAAERARVLHAIDAVRAAPSPEDADAGPAATEALAARRRLVEALEQTPAAQPAALWARNACAATYRDLLEGAALRLGVQAEIAKGTNPTPELVRRLLDAEARVNASAARLPDCERAAAELRARAR